MVSPSRQAMSHMADTGQWDENGNDRHATIKIVGKVVSVHIGKEGCLAKIVRTSVQAELDGFVGDRHKGFSRIAYEGDRLIFPSGTTLIVENYNPPCSDMSENIAAQHMTNSGEPVQRLGFCKHAKRIRGLVGSIDVPGIINTGDKIMIQHFKPPHFGKD